MRFVAGLMLTMVMAVPALGQNWEKEPTSFMGIPFGASKTEAEKISGKRFTKGGDGWISETYFPLPYRVQPIGFNVVPYVSDVGGFEKVHIGFKSEAFGTMLDLFTLRYGPPTDTDKSTVKNFTGASVTNERVVWLGQDIHIVIEHYDDSLESGAVTISAASYRARRDAEYKAKLAAIADSL